MEIFPILYETMYSYNKTEDCPYEPSKLAIHSFLRRENGLDSNCGQHFKETVSFDDMVHFTDEENIVTFVYFDCGSCFFH